LFILTAFLFVTKAYSEKKYPRLAWLLIVLSHFWVTVGVSYNDQFSLYETFIYLFGVVIAGIGGLICLQQLRKKVYPAYHLSRYFGHIKQHENLAGLFLIFSLMLIGFPISSTFIGEDLIFSHIQSNQIVSAFLLSLNYVISGIAVIRIFSRLFLGPHEASYQYNI
jgi:NADH:ubiquinone oxidoreductase subunit 2 (subunit N)